jgi:hypothetical protein
MSLAQFIVSMAFLSSTCALVSPFLDYRITQGHPERKMEYCIKQRKMIGAKDRKCQY